MTPQELRDEIGDPPGFSRQEQERVFRQIEGETGPRTERQQSEGGGPQVSTSDSDLSGETTNQLLARILNVLENMPRDIVDELQQG